MVGRLAHRDAQPSQRYWVPEHRRHRSHTRQQSCDTSSAATKLLNAIEISSTPSTLPLSTLQAHLTTYRFSWPVYHLIQCYTDCWKCLPEAAKSGSECNDLVARTLTLVKASYNSIADLLPDCDTPAIIDGHSRRQLSHRKLAKFVQQFRLPPSSSGNVVACALPNGAVLGVVSIAVASYYTLAPINATGGADQFQTDLLRTGSKSLLVLEADIQRLGLDGDWVSRHGIAVYIVHPAPDLTFTVSTYRLSPTPSVSAARRPNAPDDTCLMLFTSGTSGTKKLVPITLHSIISGVAFVGDSWKLTEQDVCLNMMPLNHIGGLVRNLFAPVLLGGCTICCSAFDPNLFWDLVAEQGPTWYYASPSMHSVILDEAPPAETWIDKSRMRMVCNAAGSLPPSLAVRLRDTFRSTVLPSYGMTECMPISAPPLDYQLERPGTSGISVGPELAILDAADKIASAGTIGRVCVRGDPLFPGYLVDGQADRSGFTSSGWFDTGDLGYMDQDGYLFITGRSKEVINRGGEIISPFEIEEAIMVASRKEGSSIFGRVSESMAFSVPHDTLQEAVGVVLVTPPGKCRPDLRQLYDAVKLSLHSTKWPIAVVYMNAAPKQNNKLCRVGLDRRMRFTQLRDDMRMSERHFEAVCPPDDTPVSVEIDKSFCKLTALELVHAIGSLCHGQADVSVVSNPKTGYLDAIVAPRSNLSEKCIFDDESLKLELQSKLDGYLIPGKISFLDTPFPRDDLGIIDTNSLKMLLDSQKGSGDSMSADESKVRDIYAELLAIPAEDIPSHADFFELGGDSLRAGRLLSILRKEFNVRIPIDKIFTSSRVSDICRMIDDSRLVNEKRNVDESAIPLGCSETCSSTNPLLLVVQLLPLAVFTPLKKAFFWLFFLKTWSMALRYIRHPEENPHLMYLFLSMLTARSAISVVSPLVGILSKWIIIGRYKEGLYPMWSVYHTRWWLVQKVLQSYGMGAFKHFNWSRVLYHRLMGAKIGRGVVIEPGTTLGEHDLLDIGDNVQLDRCICRPFAAEHNTTMYLGRIRMGKNSAAGLKAIIAPGTDLPENTCLGVNSSSWESKDATDSNYDLLGSRIPQPHWVLWVFVVLPLAYSMNAIALIPWLAGLAGMNVTSPPDGADLMIFFVGWFANPTRVGFHFLARVLDLLFGPMLFLAMVILLKLFLDLLFGRLRPGPAAKRRAVDKFRMALLNKLIPNGHIRDVTSSFGTHYEITSILVRLLGGKVGKRVYWPGNGPSVDNFDLVDIGDDVVFGSRAHLVTSDGAGCDYIRVADGAMVADRVAVLAGCHVGEQAVLGSGALTRRDTAYDAGSTWIGSKAGGPICLTAASPRSMESAFLDGTVGWDEKTLASEPSSDSDTLLETGSTSTDSITPFGRAFYRKEAPYRVLGLFTITAYSILTNIFISIYWNIPTIVSLQVLSHVSNLAHLSHFFAKSAYRPLSILSVLFVSFSVTQVTLSVLALAICVCAKWLIMGRRTAGSFDWDKSDYCQRWQMLLTVERIRLSGEDILSLLTGTHYLAAYFRLLGARIGADCALFAGGELSLSFTEPDLLTLGERVAVDDASLVGHINSRGSFNLNPLVVGDRSVLRTGSRLLSGAAMGRDACLLEHTLVMAGDEAEDGATYQGWPADTFMGARVKLFDGDSDEPRAKDQEKDQDIEMVGAGDWIDRVGGEVKRWFNKDGYERRYERIEITVDDV